MYYHVANTRFPVWGVFEQLCVILFEVASDSLLGTVS